jgi:NitT/TauT family transport system substrate-binding protein
MQDLGFSRRAFLAGTRRIEPHLSSVPARSRRTPLRRGRSVSSMPRRSAWRRSAAEELLRLEGSRGSYVKIKAASQLACCGRGGHKHGSPPCVVYRMDGRTSVVAIAGIHSGCFGVRKQRANDSRSEREDGCRLDSAATHVLVRACWRTLAWPRRDVTWIKGGMNAMGISLTGRRMHSWASLPTPELRAKKVGRSSSTPRKTGLGRSTSAASWSQSGVRHKVPVATKRTLRAYLKAADICARNPSAWPVYGRKATSRATDGARGIRGGTLSSLARRESGGHFAPRATPARVGMIERCRRS